MPEERSGWLIKEEQNLIAKRSTLANYLKVYFNKQQGVRIGETAVVSRRLHQKSPRLFPHIQILIEQDAGQYYCQCTESDRAVHIDVYHEAARIQVVPLARRIWSAINTFLTDQATASQSLNIERFKEPSDVASRIWIATEEGMGNVRRLVEVGYDQYTEIPEDLTDHVHLVAELPEEGYGLVLDLVEAVEAAIQEQGYQIQKIMGITHGFQKGVQSEDVRGFSLPWFSSRRGETDEIIRVQNQKQAIIALARRFGGVEEVRNFLDNMKGNIFQRMTNRPARKLQGDLTPIIDKLIEAGLVDKGILGLSLTEEGENLRQYLIYNQQEMEALYRVIMRRFPKGSKRYQRLTRTKTETRTKEKINKRKVLPRLEDNTSSVVAVSETVMEGAKQSLQDGLKRVRITQDDIQVYGKRSYTPINICLLVDCSASMAGDKSQAAWQLAEYLLLSSRERVAVVVFQEMNARVAVPFTRNQKRLRMGLRSVVPEGMTPLASGIMKSLELIQESGVQNPLLVLITDGMPTYPLWTYDSKADALKAARMLEEAKIRLACIGVQANREFLRELANAAHGTLYVVDYLNRDTLIQVMQEERELISGQRE